MKQIAVLLALVSLGANQAVAQEASDSETVEALNWQWVAAEASNDHATSMSFLWEDAIMYPPNSAPILGHEGIRQLYESIVFSSLEIAGPISISISGDVAASWAMMEYSFSPVGSDIVVTDEGKFIAVWERRNGEWRVMANAWNSNLPLSGN
jgi:ketosteroid isomerase-like protein